MKKSLDYFQYRFLEACTATRLKSKSHIRVICWCQNDTGDQTLSDDSVPNSVHLQRSFSTFSLHPIILFISSTIIIIFIPQRNKPLLRHSQTNRVLNCWLTANLLSSTFTPFLLWSFEEPALERRWHALCLTPDQLKPLMTAVEVCLWPPRLSEGLQGRSGRSKDTNQ